MLSRACKPLPGLAANLLHPISQDMVGCWIFNEGAGIITHDYSGNGNAGTLTNMNSEDWVGSQNGFALEFDGTEDFVDVGNTPSLDIDGDKLTLLAWTNTTTGFRAIMSKSHSNIHSSPYYKYLLFVGTGPLEFRIDSTLIAGGAIRDGMWHQAVATYDGANMYAYVDAIQVASTGKTGNIQSSNQNFRIGGRHTDSMGEYFAGKIAMAMVWTRALSAAEIRALYVNPYMMFHAPVNPVIFADFGAPPSYVPYPRFSGMGGGVGNSISGGIG